MIQVLQETNLTQLVDFKTHIRGGCLDLVITNMPEKVSNVVEAGRLGKSDHVIIQFDLELNSCHRGERKVIKNWKRADWTGIKSGLQRQPGWPLMMELQQRRLVSS